MAFERIISLLLLCFTLSAVLALHSTDTITSGGFNSRSGHQPNHNLDPNVVKSGTFGQIWRTKGVGKYNGFTEEFFAQPLVFTPEGHNQSVYAVSAQNYIYRFDALTGELLAHRQLHIPFLVADLDGCNDIANCIGSTATGVIDPARNAWFLTTKTYADQGPRTPQGLAAGRYYIHSIDLVTLEEKPNFPVPLEGMVADNAPWRMFEGGKHHQRPALLQINDYVYAGFASHCVQYNFTGWIVGWHAQSGELVARFATEGGKEKNGKGGGIWMSGGGLASDNAGRMFFATGNGYASQLADTPVPGRQPPTSLEEAVVNMAVNEDGSLTPSDFFMPWEKRDLDGMDKDLGTSGFVLLEPGVFKTASVSRIGCVAGKTGKFYFLDLNNLGGYMMGPGRKDAVLQSIQLPNAVFSSAGTYPFEGGYVYVSPVGYETTAFKFGVDADGNPVFTEAGKTAHKTAGRQGVGHMTVTTLDGQAGTGILWVTDVEGTTLRAYGTVPVDGVLPTYALINNPGQSKFSRPTFGNGRVYLSSSQGYITALGSPVNLPLNCSSPYESGKVEIGESVVTQIKCEALTAVRIDSIDLDLGTHYAVSDHVSLPTDLALGAEFSLKATFKPQVVGPLSTNINIRTTALGTVKFASNTPVVIRGTGVSVNPVLKIQPNVVSFGDTITNAPGPGQTLNFAIENGGQSELVIESYKWSTNSTSGPFITLPSAPFTFSNLPSPSSSIPAESERVVSITFKPTTDGYWPLYLILTTNAGTATVGVFGNSGAPPRAFLEWQLSNGTWIPYKNNTPLAFDGGVYRGFQATRKLRLTNRGGSTLTTTISKPPSAGALVAANPLGSIAEGSQLKPNESTVADIVCSPPKGQVNVPPLNLTAVWTMNNDDPVFGKNVLTFNCAGLSQQVGPLDGDEQGYWRYLGCYKDADPERQLEALAYSSVNNTNGMCLDKCQGYDAAKKYVFAATEYERECWCGTKQAKTKVEDEKCDFLCKGDYLQYCGGDGTLMSIFYDRRRWTPEEGGGSSSSTSAMPTSTSTSSTESGSTSDSSTTSGSATTTSASVTTESSSTTTSSATPTASGLTYLGCYLEPPSARALSAASTASPNLTPSICQTYCTSLNLPLYGLEYASECFCGSTLHPAALLSPPSDNRCNMPCSGSPSDICGGSSALSVWNNTALDEGAGGVLDGWEDFGCWSEPKEGHALRGGSTAGDEMTNKVCRAWCGERGWGVAGTEWGRECYCGDQIEGEGAEEVDRGECNVRCAGEKAEWCGGGRRLSVWRKVE